MSDAGNGTGTSTVDRASGQGGVSTSRQRWGAAVGFRGPDFLKFATKYFSAADRRVLLFAGAGFDPRTPCLAEALTGWARGNLDAVFLREERPAPDAALRALADEHSARLAAAVPGARTETIPVFAMDNAVIGGRNAATVAGRAPFDGVTDIVVDLSALSVGISFPLVGVLLERATELRCNLHAVVASDAALDARIIPQPTEAATAVHGFRGELGLDHRASAARLWLPQLATRRGELLDRVFREVAPHDICPILPFPAADPRAGDALVDEYLRELEDVWDVDARNFIYAAEDDPLDVYRTILELNDAREPVFAGDGGSLCVLSPVGSKVLALGALMAAAERNFPVLHVEAVGFTADAGALRAYPVDRGAFAHVWLSGDPYPKLSPPDEASHDS